jgi:hypothetical protein
MTSQSKITLQLQINVDMYLQILNEWFVLFVRAEIFKLLNKQQPPIINNAYRLVVSDYSNF